MRKIIIATLLMVGTLLYGSDESTFTLTNTEGVKIHVKDIKEGLLFEEHKNALFLLMFGHNCPPCKEEIPNFIELTNKYGDKLTIIGIEVQGYTTQQVGEFKRANGINYDLVSGKDNYDFVRHIVQRAGWKGAIPFLIAIDKNGAVQALQAGLIKKKSLEELIAKLNK